MIQSPSSSFLSSSSSSSSCHITKVISTTCACP